MSGDIDAAQDMDENKLLEVERLKTRSNRIWFSSTAKENQARNVSIASEANTDLGSTLDRRRYEI